MSMHANAELRQDHPIDSDQRNMLAASKLSRSLPDVLYCLTIMQGFPDLSWAPHVRKVPKEIKALHPAQE